MKLLAIGRFLWKTVVVVWEEPAESLFFVFTSSIGFVTAFHVASGFFMAVGLTHPQWPCQLLPLWVWWALASPLLLTWAITTIRLLAEGATGPWLPKEVVEEVIADRANSTPAGQLSHPPQAVISTGGGT